MKKITVLLTPHPIPYSEDVCCPECSSSEKRNRHLTINDNQFTKQPSQL
jgi:hypothetical protein